MKPKLLIVDDDKDIRTQMKWALSQDYDILLAEDRMAAVEAYREHRPAVVTLDLGLPPSPNSTEEGFAALSEILGVDKSAKVIVISGQGDKRNAIAAVGAGAFDFHCKPVELDDLKLILRRCSYVAGLEREYSELQNSRSMETFEGMLGGSAEMRGVFGLLRKVGPTTAPVLILGESGTGKELAAQAIHSLSGRRSAPFVAINCNAIPENLIESELFGHEKGAFTGAHSQRKGLVDSASGGTLFLDEVGELPLPIQVKLLRFLQERTFQRVGGRQEIKIDTRVVAATNADLKQMIADGKFREDLYYRLSVVSIVLPSLKDRGSDLELLAKEFLGRFAGQNNKKGLSFAADTMNAINRHSWPGNIRELQNRVQRAVIMASGKRISIADMELEDVAAEAARPTLKEARESVEREYVTNALKRNTGNMTAAAAELGISRPTLYELMEKLGIPKGA